MTSLLRFAAPAMFMAAGALVSAQVLLPSVPPKKFGGSVTPAFEGWYDNADGTHTFLVGYFSRNTDVEIDVPIGPNNHFSPGNADVGQPTHFLPKRRFGMFIVTVPKEFTPQQKLSWTLTVNGITTTVPMYMSPDYNVTPFRSSEEGADGGYNEPPVLRFAANGVKTFKGPVAAYAAAIERTATTTAPMTLDVFADDDGRFATGSNAPILGARTPVNLLVSKYRGPGAVTIEEKAPKLTAAKGGKPGEPFSGTATTAVRFSEPGEYVLHVTANDYSGNGGGGSVCCWTTALVKVAVKGGAPVNPTGNQ
jgi:hypothetical protein